MSRLTIELRPGVFIGNIGRRVREKLWERIVDEWHANALMIYSTNNEQGYQALSNGDTTRAIVEYEGMVLTQFIHSRKSQMRDLPDDELSEEEMPEENSGSDPVEHEIGHNISPVALGEKEPGDIL